MQRNSLISITSHVNKNDVTSVEVIKNSARVISRGYIAFIWAIKREEKKTLLNKQLKSLNFVTFPLSPEIQTVSLLRVALCVFASMRP